MRKVILTYDLEIAPGVIVPAGTAIIADPSMIGRMMLDGLITREIRETQMVRPPEYATRVTRGRQCGLN